MIISMSDILCITNRGLCREDFLSRMEKLAKAKPGGIILREKDLSPQEYLLLARQVMDICRTYEVSCILHTHTEVALSLGATALHLPLPLLVKLSPKERKSFSCLGVSCHSVEDALLAESLDCTYITAGHVFDTACKKGIPGRGLDFLREICQKISIPVYGLGGITPQNSKSVNKAGAAGICIMSLSLIHI